MAIKLWGLPVGMCFKREVTSNPVEKNAERWNQRGKKYGERTGRNYGVKRRDFPAFEMNRHLSDIDGVLRQGYAIAQGCRDVVEPGALFKEGHDRQELKPSSEDHHTSRYYLTGS